MRREQSVVRSITIQLLFNLLLICSLVNQGTGLGQVEAVLKTISTSDGKLTDGSKCRADTCKIKMKVTFTQPVPSPKVYKTKYMEFKSSLILPQSGDGALNDGVGTEFDNPINVTAPAKDKLKQFSVNIEIDDYSNYRKIKMATLKLTENVTTGFIYNRTLTQDSATVTLSFKVICEENYYFDCSVFCVGHDDNSIGHFTCDPVTGGKVCLEGWTGDDCLMRTCTSNLVMTGGRVTSTPQTIYKENDTITIECDPEFQLNPHLQSNVLTCEADGQWSFNDFTKICTKSACGGCSRLREPKHGRLTYRSLNYCHNANANSTVSVTCYPNYAPLVRYQGLTCGEDGQWVNSTGQSVEEGVKHLIDCIATGDSDVDVSEEALKKRLAKSAMVIGIITLFSFFAIILLYCFLYRRREKKRKVSPRRKSYVPEEELGRRKTLKCAGIGNVVTKPDVPAVNSDTKPAVPAVNKNSDHGPISTAAYVNHGFANNDYEFDYEF